MSKKQWFSLLTAVLLVSSVAGFGGGYFALKLKPATAPTAESAKATIINEDSAVVEVAKQASPAVVSITASKELTVVNSGWQLDPFFRQFFGSQFEGLFGDQAANGEDTDKQKRQIGGGTGFIVSADGLIVTNKHVVADEQAEYTVTTNDQQEYVAKVLARDPINDLAIIKIEAKQLPYLELGDSSKIAVGQRVIAIGNALGEFSNTVSVGVVSGLSRSITAGSLDGSERLVGLIQTDASINPGNSGGPLLDLGGKVVGINVAMAQGAQSIGFAIPANQAKQAVESVKKNGRLVRPWLGLRYLMISPVLAKQQRLPKDYGALVVRGDQRQELAVIPGSPADKAGIVENDIILELDGQRLDGDNDLARLLSDKSPGQEISLKIYHRGEEKIIKVKLAEAK